MVLATWEIKKGGLVVNKQDNNQCICSQSAFCLFDHIQSVLYTEWSVNIDGANGLGPGWVCIVQ